MTDDGVRARPNFNRPGSSLRRRALVGDDVPDHPVSAGDTGPRSFRETLRDIPDLDERADAEATAQEPVVEPEMAARRLTRPDRAATLRAEDDARTVVPATVGPVDDDLGDGTVEPEARVEAKPRRPWWRRLAFGLTMALLFASIPLLGREGYRLVTTSRAGKAADDHLAATAPNYVEQVESTPTMLIAQTDAEGKLDALTVLSLTSDKGGTIMFVPIRARLRESRYGISDIDTYFEAQKRRIPPLTVMVGEVLNVGIDRVEAFDDRTFVRMLAPVGALKFRNPDPMTLPDGTVLEAGEVSLQPTQVGPYLAYLGEGEDQFSQYLRHQLVWQAWLAAIRDSGDTGAVPGGENDQLTMFLRRLAAGNVRMETIPGTYEGRDDGTFTSEEPALASLVLDAVPVPDSPKPGARKRIRILNGVAPGAPPASVVRTLVSLDGMITVVGNGPSFGQSTTEVVYSDPKGKADAQKMLGALGLSDGTVRFDETQADESDFTVIMGKDLLDTADQLPPPTFQTSSTTTPASTTTN